MKFYSPWDIQKELLRHFDALDSPTSIWNSEAAGQSLADRMKLYVDAQSLIGVSASNLLASRITLWEQLLRENRSNDADRLFAQIWNAPGITTGRRLDMLEPQLMHLVSTRGTQYAMDWLDAQLFHI